ncbi:hypothetical protein COCCADRAFT_80287, partial [Bipolaris zeicola 26-R-13]
MGFVYKMAAEVRIWLGSVTDVCKSTPNIQEELANYRSRRVPIPKGSYSLLSPEENTDEVLGSESRLIIRRALLEAMKYVMDDDRLLGQEIRNDCFLDEIQALGMRIIAMQPWWRRVWVIQEATLPEREPIMQCDNFKIGYRKFLESADHFMFSGTPLIPSRTHIPLIVHGMFQEGHEPSETSLASRLLTYLSCMSGNFEVTKPKDRVNGSYPLRILESGPSNIEGIPSWVPLWESKTWIGEDKNRGAPES